MCVATACLVVSGVCTHACVRLGRHTLSQDTHCQAVSTRAQCRPHGPTPPACTVPQWHHGSDFSGETERPRNRFRDVVAVFSRVVSLFLACVGASARRCHHKQQSITNSTYKHIHSLPAHTQRGGGGPVAQHARASAPARCRHRAPVPQQVRTWASLIAAACVEAHHSATPARMRRRARCREHFQVACGAHPATTGFVTFYNYIMQPQWLRWWQPAHSPVRTTHSGQPCAQWHAGPQEWHTT